MDWNAILEGLGISSPVVVGAVLTIRHYAIQHVKKVEECLEKVSAALPELTQKVDRLQEGQNAVRSDMDKWEETSIQSRLDLEKTALVLAESIKNLERTVDRLSGLISQWMRPPS